MTGHLTPYAVAVALIGRPEHLGAVCGLHRTSAYGWESGSKNRDPGDLPPRANRALLAYSRRHGLGLTADHLIHGASAAEIDAILEARAAGRVAA